MFRSFFELILAHRHSRESWSPEQRSLGKDRRIFERVSVNVPCRMDHRLFGLQTAGTAVNLSLGGVGVTAAVNWPEGSQVRVFIEALDVELEGLIVFRKEAQPESRYGHRASASVDDGHTPPNDWRYGVKFQGLGVRSLWRLRRALKDNFQGPLALK